MGQRLGYRVVVKISNWFRVSKKSRPSVHLQSENSKEPYRGRLGHRLCMRSVNSRENSRDSRPVNFTVGSVKSTSDDNSHLPHLQIPRFLQRFILVTQFRLSHISQGSRKVILQYLSREIDSSKRVQVPKGFLVVRVGRGEESQRFWIPVLHFNDPLFAELLKEVEDEYGFDHQGVINIPCDVSDFQNLQKLISTKHKGQTR